jgi:hypothetical protein
VVILVECHEGGLVDRGKCYNRIVSSMVDAATFQIGRSGRGTVAEGPTVEGHPKYRSLAWAQKSLT